MMLADLSAGIISNIKFQKDHKEIQNLNRGFELQKFKINLEKLKRRVLT
jgi:hypothetical protein